MTQSFLSIIVIAVVLNVLGFIWYGKTLFGKSWLRVMGVDPNMSKEEMKEKSKGMTGLYILNFLLSIVTVFVLAWALGDEKSVSTAMQLSFVIWFGFSMPMHASSAIWSGKPKMIAKEMFLITTGYQLVAFVVAGALIALW